MKAICESNQEKQRQKFLKLFYSIIDDESNFNLIQWHESGFVILDVEQFKQTILPQHFKHNNYQSLMRQLNKYGFKIKSKENQKAYFSHPTINKENRQTKQSLKTSKLISKIDYDKELRGLKKKIHSIQDVQKQFQKELSVSLQIMIHLQKCYQKLYKTTIQTVGFTNWLGNLMYENHKRVWGHIGGDLFLLQLNSFALGFPEVLAQTQMVTPCESIQGTPLPFYQMFQSIKPYIEQMALANNKT